MRTKNKWYRTGACRIVPWYFGLMRAEFLERRDFKDETGEVMAYQIRWVSAGRFPDKYDGPDAFGFWSTLASKEDRKYGERTLWRRFINYWPELPPPDNQ